MNRLLALLLLPLLLFAQSADALGAICADKAGGCAEMHSGVDAQGCCGPAACACGAAPAREESAAVPCPAGAGQPRIGGRDLGCGAVCRGERGVR